MTDTKNVLDVLHLLHVESIDFFVYVNVNVSYLGKDVEAHISHMILYMLYQTTKPSPLKRGNHTLR